MLDDEEGGSDSQVLKVEQQSCCSQHRAAGIALFVLKSDLVPGLHNHGVEVELVKSADPTFVQQKR
jgi:hypothetical protein